MATRHEVTVQGAVVGVSYGVDLGPFSPNVAGSCTLSVAEGGLASGNTAARLIGWGNYVTNNGDIMGQAAGLELLGAAGASTMKNFGLISARGEVVSIRKDTYTQSVTLKNAGAIAGGEYAYFGGGGADTVVNRGALDGAILLNSGNDTYKGARGVFDGAVSGGNGNDRIVCGADDDLVNGGAGSDTLKGGTVEDQFYFNTALASIVDTILAFSALDDRINLSKALFTQIADTGFQSSDQFAANATALPRTPAIASSMRPTPAS